MDLYIPKRRVPVTVWSGERQGTAAHLFLDLDPSSRRNQTLLEKVNESAPFLVAAVGDEGRIHLFNKTTVSRITPGRQVLQSDVFARGFQPWREEEAELTLADGAVLSGRVWMPLERESQRLSDFMNQQGSGFFVILTPVGPHLVNPTRVLEVKLLESAGSPLAPVSEGADAAA